MKQRSRIIIIVYFLLTAVSIGGLAQNVRPKEIIWTTDWSPNEDYFAYGGNVDSLKIYSAKNGKVYKSFPVKNTITRIKWHPTLNVIAVVTQMSEEKSFILDLTNNVKIALTGISPDGARGLGWNYTGEYLAVADNDGQILIYDVKGNLIRKFPNDPNSTKSITALEWHPYKDILSTVTDKIRLYDMKGNLLNTIQHRQEEVMLLSISWHKSGDFFVTGDYGDEKIKSLLQFWSKDGKLLKSIEVSKAEIRNLAWNKKGNRLASASDSLRIWDTKGNLHHEGSSNDYLWGVSWNNSGRRIVTSSMQQSIVLWNKKAERIQTLD